MTALERAREAQRPDMDERPYATVTRLPGATYRWQLNREFNCRQAAALVDYLEALGVSDVYASPLLAARPGSKHGYDVTDHGRLNPEIGTPKEFAALARKLGRRGLGFVLDIVPNHMCVAGGGNQWWNDVLENGPSSPFARFFDVDWQPPKADLVNKVLLPALGDQYGRVLENQEITISYEDGAFLAHYYDMRLPVAPRTYTRLLALVLPQVRRELGETHLNLLELESIITALSHLPPRTEADPERVKERRREKEVVKRRLSALAGECEAVNRAIRDAVAEFNGVRGDLRSFDRLEALLADQGWRLSHWRVASDEINYRRFFDINELAAIRVEDPEVFAAVHRLPFRWLRKGWVTGFRVDHVDGLYDPEQYLLDLRRGCAQALARPGETESDPGRADVARAGAVGGPCYVVAEKILGHHELLRGRWAAYGTTGYEFLNLLNGLFVEAANEASFRRLYERFTGRAVNFSDLVYECKKLILRVAMSGELFVLARKLDRVSEQHRYTRDFTFNSLQYALGEVIACFPVYRSYVRPGRSQVAAEDRAHILAAVREAKRRNPAVSPSIFDFIGSLLFLEDPDGLTASEREERRDFVMRFQQLTGPVMAKGLEDTAFYRYYPLASLNEVGGEPERFGVPVGFFHFQNQQRLLHWPHALSATATHDTKRGEDVRARLNALSEIPARWYRAVCRWRGLNRGKKVRAEGLEIPDANEEYLFYQTLVGVWPFGPPGEYADAGFVQRIEEYLVKALREAKVHSSWVSVNEGYERAVREFVRAVLRPGPDDRFLASFAEFHAPIARAGVFNSLAQTLLKIAAPGVPDFYQGTELWDFSLVAPDNSRPVDYSRRREWLAALQAAAKKDLPALVDELRDNPEDGRLKLLLTSRALHFRRERRELFKAGSYLPLEVSGERGDQVVAFARESGESRVVVAVGRFFLRLGEAARQPVGQQAWGETTIHTGDEIGSGCYRDVLTGREVRARAGGQGLSVSEIFAHLPVALLERV
jgi:(1->4)-alpha-D-glucan 1-alpha-D-glucosylmutase